MCASADSARQRSYINKCDESGRSCSRHPHFMLLIQPWCDVNTCVYMHRVLCKLAPSVLCRHWQRCRRRRRRTPLLVMVMRICSGAALQLEHCQMGFSVNNTCAVYIDPCSAAVAKCALETLAPFQERYSVKDYCVILYKCAHVCACVCALEWRAFKYVEHIELTPDA